MLADVGVMFVACTLLMEGPEEGVVKRYAGRPDASEYHGT